MAIPRNKSGSPRATINPVKEPIGKPKKVKKEKKDVGDVTPTDD